MFLMGLIIGGILAVAIYACFIGSKDDKNDYIEELNYSREEAKAYATVAIYSLQNSANGENKLKDITLDEIEREIDVMLNIYSKEKIIAAAKRAKNI